MTTSSPRRPVEGAPQRRPVGGLIEAVIAGLLIAAIVTALPMFPLEVIFGAASLLILLGLAVAYLHDKIIERG